MSGVTPSARQAPEVTRVPAFKEEGSPGAYYDAPSFDATRPGNFYVNLIGPHEKMSVINRKAANAHQAVKRSGEFGSVNRTGFRVSLRKIAACWIC